MQTAAELRRDFPDAPTPRERRLEREVEYLRSLLRTAAGGTELEEAVERVIDGEPISATSSPRLRLSSSGTA